MRREDQKRDNEMFSSAAVWGREGVGGLGYRPVTDPNGRREMVTVVEGGT